MTKEYIQPTIWADDTICTYFLKYKSEDKNIFEEELIPLPGSSYE
jgi:hypothetical protein